MWWSGRSRQCRLSRPRQGRARSGAPKKGRRRRGRHINPGRTILLVPPSQSTPSRQTNSEIKQFVVRRHSDFSLSVPATSNLGRPVRASGQESWAQVAPGAELEWLDLHGTKAQSQKWRLHADTATGSCSAMQDAICVRWSCHLDGRSCRAASCHVSDFPHVMAATPSLVRAPLAPHTFLLLQKKYRNGNGGRAGGAGPRNVRAQRDGAEYGAGPRRRAATWRNVTGGMSPCLTPNPARV